jgi:hypothetical protein
MRINQTRHEHHVTEVPNLAGVCCQNVARFSDGHDAVFLHNHGAVLDGRRRDRQHHARPQNHPVTPVGSGTRTR